jgi:hypothetical protein
MTSLQKFISIDVNCHLFDCSENKDISKLVLIMSSTCYLSTKHLPVLEIQMF